MKKITFFAVFAFISITCFSQDVISLKRGVKLDATVTEITPTLVRYKLFTEPNGRIYFMYKDDVDSIVYKNGKVEKFIQSDSDNQKIENESGSNDNDNQNDNQNPNPNPIQPPRPIFRGKNYLETQHQPANRVNQTNDFTLPNNKNEDIIYLKNGSIIRGTIIEQIPNKSVKIKMAEGNVFTCQMKDIDRIVKNPFTGNDQNPSNDSIQNPFNNPFNDNSQNSFNGNGQDVFDDNGQPTETSSEGLHPGYKGIIGSGIYLGIGADNINRINFSFINGAQVNPYFSFGIGVGVNYYIGIYDTTWWVNTAGHLILVPIFADFRVNILNKRISPYIASNIGYSLNASNDFCGYGFLAEQTMGVSFKVSDMCALHLGLGCQMQLEDGIDYSDYAGALAFAVKFGFSF